MKIYILIFTMIFCSGFTFCQTQKTDEITKRAIRIVIQTLKDNNQWNIYQQYTKYVSDILDRTSGDKWWNDKNGYFRLRTIDRWLRNPVDCIVEGESITQRLHQLCRDRNQRINAILKECTELLDLEIQTQDASDREKLTRDYLNKKISIAEKYVQTSFANFSPAKMAEFMELTERLTVRQVGDIVAHSLPEKQAGLSLASKAARIEMAELIKAAIVLSNILNHPDFENLKKMKSGRYGKFFVGSKRNDEYDIDKMENIAFIIEPGGNDTYTGGKTRIEKPVLLTIDFEGNDRYIAPDGFAQGSGFFGVSILYDKNGNDIYEGTDVCQAAGLMGIGILIDDNGDDIYNGDRRTQGSAVCGIGILIDRKGNDRYSTNLLGQGYGGMFGIGILEDTDGNDYYRAGGKYDEPYQEPPHYYKHAWSQGCGSGFRGISNGGFGIMLDGGGDDIYEADYFSTGGYWFAAGIARDFGGNDTRKPLTHNFTRYGFGYACHYAVGLLYDDTGNDTYIGTLGIQGFGWDIGTAVLIDSSGNDSYTATISGQGFACQGSWALLLDGDGSDTYTGKDPMRVQGIPGPLEYHPKSLVGGNFSFLIDIGKGNDEFSSGAWQKGINPRNTENGAGYLINIE
ncbi:MAG: hypothetical protein NC830_01275 [Candidatus Omnitrophica bacterium]|nr:hypothetical protein [Candidatus Omnitrophota bacterium]